MKEKWNGIGKAAVDCALSGKTAQMMTINRKSEAEYSVFYSSADISGIANAVKTVPKEYINSDGNGVTEKCLEYLSPLILGEVAPVYEAGMPKHLII